jgi:hypothetical protein
VLNIKRAIDEDSTDDSDHNKILVESFFYGYELYNSMQIQKLRELTY